MNAIEELATKLKEIEKLHEPIHHYIARSPNGIGRLISHVSKSQAQFTTCSICHQIEEDELDGLYYGRSGDYPCETIAIITK